MQYEKFFKSRLNKHAQIVKLRLMSESPLIVHQTMQTECY